MPETARHTCATGKRLISHVSTLVAGLTLGATRTVTPVAKLERRTGARLLVPIVGGMHKAHTARSSAAYLFRERIVRSLISSYTSAAIDACLDCAIIVRSAETPGGQARGPDTRLLCVAEGR